MRNLFVVHTQYNLILALGLKMNKFLNNANDLILFVDFDLKDELEKKLEKNYDRYLILEGNFPKKEMSSKQKYEKIVSDNKKIREFCGQIYDNVFIVDDMCIQEMYIMKCVMQKNKNVQFAWLEDGANAYFDNGVISGGMGSTPFRRWIRKVCFSLRFGLGSCYDLGECMGHHKLLKKAYFTFPEAARKEFYDREHCHVTPEAFEIGMKEMYGGNVYPFEENAILIAMDKIDVYGETVDVVNQLVQDEVDTAQKNRVRVYFKYHPRETESLPALINATELDRNVALESYLANSEVKTLNVIGIKSTALQTAKKMGYKTISLIKQVDKNALPILEFYQKIGIECR